MIRFVLKFTCIMTGETHLEVAISDTDGDIHSLQSDGFWLIYFVSGISVHPIEECILIQQYLFMYYLHLHKMSIFVSIMQSLNLKVARALHISASSLFLCM